MIEREVLLCRCMFVWAYNVFYVYVTCALFNTVPSQGCIHIVASGVSRSVDYLSSTFIHVD